MALAAKQLGERHQAWRTQLPEQPEGLWDWLTRQDMQTLIGLLAYCVAATVKPERTDAFDALAGAVGLDMAQWRQPTAANYLGRVPKALILEAVTEGVSLNAAANLASLRKGDMATAAEERLAGKGFRLCYAHRVLGLACGSESRRPERIPVMFEHSASL